jgi:hypothetical protein
MGFVMTASLLLATALSVTTQEVHLYRGMQMGQEWDIYFVSKQLIESVPGTTSYLVTTKVKDSSGERSLKSIVQCSKTEPAIISVDPTEPTKAIQTTLAIGVTPSGFEGGMHEAYWYTCHQLKVNPLDEGYGKLAQRYEYQTIEKTSKQASELLSNYPMLEK